MYKQILRALLHRPRQANKYDFGHVLIVGGSPGMVGAPYLAGLAALRSGAGLVTVASTTEVVGKLEERTVELLTLRLPHDVKEAAERVKVYVQKRHITVIVLGPGMTPEFAKLARELVGKIEIPLVLDAGAATTFKGRLEHFEKAKDDVILTPHNGEMKELIGEEMPRELVKRCSIARVFARNYHVTLVAKGSPTLVAHGDDRVYVNPTGTPALATAGTGDVLTGVLAALIAQHISAFQAAELAVYLHGLAGDLAEKEKTEPGVIASDVIDKIPTALQKMSKKT
jgi:NAD(P)H-hydrate epimerase